MKKNKNENEFSPEIQKLTTQSDALRKILNKMEKIIPKYDFQLKTDDNKINIKNKK